MQDLLRQKCLVLMNQNRKKMYYKIVQSVFPGVLAEALA